MIEYSVAQESDYPGINEFHNRIYGAHRTMEQFYWEFHHNPAGRSIYIIALEKQKIIGTQCMIPVYLLDHSGERILSGKSEDTLVDPSFRGQNVSKKMYDLLFDQCNKNEIKVIWGLTSATKALIKSGFEHPFKHNQVLVINKITRGYHFLSSLNQKNTLTDKLTIYGLSIASKINTLIHGKNPVSCELTISQEDVRDVSAIQGSILEQNDRYFMISHSPEYIQWRIYDNPNYFRIQTFSLRNKDQKLAGVIFLNATEDNIFYIIESLFSNELSIEAQSAFIRQVTHTVFRQGAVLVRNWVFSHNEFNMNETAAYQKAGYLLISRGISLVWKKMTDISIDPHGFLLSRLATQGDI